MSQAAVRKADGEREGAEECNSEKACILSLSLAACVININSTKWAVIKLSSCKWSPKTQLEHKTAQTCMHSHRHAARHISPVCACIQYVPFPPPSPPSHSNKRTQLFSDWLSNQKYYYWLLCEKRESELNKICFSWQAHTQVSMNF